MAALEARTVKINQLLLLIREGLKNINHKKMFKKLMLLELQRKYKKFKMILM